MISVLTCELVCAWQYFHMGWTEFRDLSSSQHGFKDRAKDLSEHSASLGFVYSQDDHWAPLKHKQKLQAGLPSAFFCTLDAGDADGKAIAHAFVTTTHGSKHVADVTCNMFCKIGVFSGIRCALFAAAVQRPRSYKPLGLAILALIYHVCVPAMNV